MLHYGVIADLLLQLHCVASIITSKQPRAHRDKVLNGVNMISGKVVYIWPLKLQASFRAHDITRKHELVAAGHCFGKVSVLATMAGEFYPNKLEWTLDAHQLKFNGRSAQMYLGLVGHAIVAFVRS